MAARCCWCTSTCSIGTSISSYSRISDSTQPSFLVDNAANCRRRPVADRRKSYNQFAAIRWNVRSVTESDCRSPASAAAAAGGRRRRRRRGRPAPITSVIRTSVFRFDSKAGGRQHRRGAANAAFITLADQAIRDATITAGHCGVDKHLRLVVELFDAVFSWEV